MENSMTYFGNDNLFLRLVKMRILGSKKFCILMLWSTTTFVVKEKIKSVMAMINPAECISASLANQVVRSMISKEESAMDNLEQAELVQGINLADVMVGSLRQAISTVLVGVVAQMAETVVQTAEVLGDSLAEVVEWALDNLEQGELVQGINMKEVVVGSLEQVVVVQTAKLVLESLA